MSDPEPNLTWFVVEPPPGKKAPKWARSVALKDDGTIWIPAALVGGEMEVFLCACFDGTALFSWKKHVFVETGWAKREFRRHAELVEKIEGNVRRASERAAGTEV
jgi:hypothetical protein